MNIIGLIPLWLIVGAVLGALAHRFVHTAANTALWLDLGVGMFGAFSAGLVFSILDVPPVANFATWAVLSSAAGACVLLFLLRMYIYVPASRQH